MYDLSYDESQNILTPQGFALALYNVLNVKQFGGLTLAPVCSTWVFMTPGLPSCVFFFAQGSHQDAKFNVFLAFQADPTKS